MYWSSLPCLVQLTNWLHVSDYHKFLVHWQMIVWKLIVHHEKLNISATETSCKMASTLSKMFFCFFFFFFFFFFWPNSSKFCTFRAVRFGSNFVNMWFKYVSKYCMERLQTSSVKICNGNKEVGVVMANSLQKLIFHRAFYVTVTDPDIGSPKYLHTLVLPTCCWNLNKIVWWGNDQMYKS